MINLRIGNGFDVHPLVPGRDLILGGVKIDFPLGLQGHSDGDVLIHAIIDALLGAASLGDIGRLFPDTDPANKGANSINFLIDVGKMLSNHKVDIINIDCIVICEKPKIAPIAAEMSRTMAIALGIDASRIGIKGKTTEKLGFTGRGEGIAVQAVALVNLGK